MRRVEEKLREYKGKRMIQPKEEKLEETLKRSKEIFYTNIQKKDISYLEFLYQQAGYIQKRWWLFQLIVLLLVWFVAQWNKSDDWIQRSMGVFAPAFVIMLIPELWKNRSSHSMEIEATAFFSLRQIYSARMLLFAMVDSLLLSVFAAVVSFTAQIRVEELLIQFFLPMAVTCCICFGTLCSKYMASEYIAIILSIMWTAIWILVILKDSIYSAISTPVWIGTGCCCVIYMVYVIQRILNHDKDYWEVNMSWN